MAADFKDLRFLFMRGLIDHEKSQRSRHYLKSAAECTSRAIVSLELALESITTVKQAKRLEAIGGETCVRLGRLDEERNFSSLKPLPGRFVSSAGAILVTLLDLTNEKVVTGKNNTKDILVSEEAVRAQSRFLCEEQFIDNNTEGFCIAWWRLEVLIKRGYIKRRSHKKKPVLQLLPPGQIIAQRLKGKYDIQSSIPTVTASGQKEVDQVQVGNMIVKNGQPSTSITGAINTETCTKTPLYSNDRGKEGVVLLVDTQEMGGERAGLGELCGLLEKNGVCYRTKKLPTGDYSWLWNKPGVEIELPCLAERKRADDIPFTLKEGRFWSQINKMLDWKRGFTDRGIDCHLHYILERRPEEYVVKCTDGCMGIGQCGNPTLSQIKMVIDDLKHHPGLLVKETSSLEITAVLLKSLTDELEQRALKGDFDALIQQTTNTTIPLIKEEKEALHGVTIPELDLSYEEQLKLAIEKSVKDTNMKHEAIVNPENNDFGRRLDYKSHDIDNVKGLETMTGQASSSYPAVSVTTKLPDTPLMQYHCSVESSVTCQQSDAGLQSDIYKDEYRPRINRKRTHTSPFVEFSEVHQDNVRDGTVKEPSHSNYVETEHFKLEDNNSGQCDKERVNDKPFKKTTDIRGNEPESIETKMDKTDEILESLRRTYAVKTEPHDSALHEQSMRTPDRRDYKCRISDKPIKLNLSPSKLFIETNIIKVKEEPSSVKYKKRKKDISATGCFDDTCPDSVGKEKSSQIENSAILRTSSPGEKASEIIDKLSDDIDNISTKSLEDIFADTPSQEDNPIPACLQQSSGNDNLNQDNKNRVTDWLNDCESSDKDKHKVDKAISGMCSSEENSKDSLPDLDLKPEVHVNNDISTKCDNEDSSESDIVILDDRELNVISSPTPNCSYTKGRKRKNGRKGHDSGYESEDVRYKGRNTAGVGHKNDIVGVVARPRNSSFNQAGVTRFCNNSDNIHYVSDDLMVSKIETVLGVLPHFRRNRVRNALIACSFNVEQCISMLLDQPDQNLNESNTENNSVIDLTD